MTVSRVMRRDEQSQLRQSTRQRLLTRVRSSVFLTSAAFAADNFLATLGLIGAGPSAAEHLSGTRIDEDVAYAKMVADAYMRYGSIKGRVAEVGPGGSAAAALFLLAHGCDSVDLIDRFPFQHDKDSLAKTYSEILKRVPEIRSRVRSANDLRPNINFHVGEQASAEVFFTTDNVYDAIVSYVVLEHLYDPIQAIRSMASALKPGGSMLHHIDFRDHGMFSAGGHHELTFLTIPSAIYRHMSQRRGRPNRVLANQYRNVLASLKVDYRILVAHLVGVGMVEPLPYAELPAEIRQRAEQEAERIRPRLAREFQNLSVEDLAVSGIFLSARKVP